MCPILVKLLFTTERLSVQVHPDDVYARQHHGSLGKTEAWYVLRAEPPAEVAIGFQEALSREGFHTAIRTGDIENLLDWRKVNRGDVIFVPAGTVHAIGAGLTICEVQENSDITYRLYDYGRPRELHIEHGSHVSHRGPHTVAPRLLQLADGREELVSCEYFRIERLLPRDAFTIATDMPTYVIAMCTSGEATVDGEPSRAGEAWLIPAGTDSCFSVAGKGTEWILTYRSPAPLEQVSVQ